MAQTIKSVKSGGWSDPATWDLNRVPHDGDKIIIGNDTRVTCEADMKQVRGGTVTFEGMGAVLDTSRIKVSGLAFKGGNAAVARED